MESRSDSSIEATIGLGPTKNRTRLKRWIFWTAAAMGLTAAVFAWRILAVEPPVRYKTQPVTRGTIVVRVTATGSLAATNEVVVGSELSGIIKTVEADYNDRVEKGQPLARLDSTKFEAAVMKSRAALVSARAGLRQAQATLKEKENTLRRYQKTRELTGGKMPSEEDLAAAEAAAERAEADVTAASAAIDEAMADLKLDETDLAKTVIYSPINGIVLSRGVETGQTVAASLSAPVLFTLAEDLTRMDLQVDVDEADVGQVKEGQAAIFTVDAYPDRNFATRIEQVRFASSTTDGVVTYKTILNVENNDLLLRPGMTATADITVEKVADVVMVPNTALRFTPSQSQGKEQGRGFIRSLLPGPRHRRGQKAGKENEVTKGRKQKVWVLEQGHPVAVTIGTGVSDGSFTEVTDGNLNPDQELVVESVSEAS
ncbi:MAG: efflux RND transporter periplasmic adaptor subunit [Desulfobacterales bacterium]|nr:efflux RND transporter periplasmic adaptor subunit [Desulfobacterales bacterium]